MLTKPKSPPNRRRRLLRAVGEVLLALAIFAGIRAWQQRDLPRGPAPALVGLAPSGEQLSLAALHGRPVLVHFWASWCSICKLEQGTIDDLARRPGTQVLTVASSSGDAAKVAAWMKSQGLAFPTVVDEEGELAEAWGVAAMPTTFFVGPEGDIRFTEVGYTTKPGMLARLWWAGR